MEIAKTKLALLLLVIGLAGCGGAQPSDVEPYDYSYYVAAVPDLPPVQVELIPPPPLDIEVEPNEPEEEVEELTPEEIRELLEGIPYPGMSLRSPDDWLEEYIHQIVNSETTAELARFIYAMNWWGMGLIRASFGSPEEADAQFVFSRAFWATSPVQWRHPEGRTYHPELSVIEPYINRPWEGITLHSHMEITAAQLFGVELKIYPYAFPDWYDTYNLYGIYAYNIGGFGSPFVRLPVILSYEYIGGGYLVVCAFPSLFLGEDVDIFFPEGWPTEGEGLSADELLVYLQTTPSRHTITLKNNPNGGFYYWAHILPPDLT